jgi:FkbM family methyltransferase
MFIKHIRTRTPLVLRHLPFLARYYRYAFQTPAGRASELFFYLPLRKLFPVCRKLGCLPNSGSFDYERLGKTVPIRFDANNLQFQALYSRIYEYGYEQELGLLLDCLLPEGGTFYDVGSNWGYFSLYAASNRSRVKIHAFEPFPGTHHDLKSCVEQAGIADLVTRHELALADADGEAFIEIPDGLHSGTAELTADSRGTRIITKRLDSLLLPPADFIKMDVEGHEAGVLRGGLNTLKSSWPYLVFENRRNITKPGTTLDPLLILQELGYRFFLPSVRQSYASTDYFLPCGWQMEIQRAQEVRDNSYLALAPFEVSNRFLYQHDLNVFACHESKLAQIRASFEEWRPAQKATA